MNKHLVLFVLMLAGMMGLHAQPVAEFRVENESLTSSTTYEFDVYIYNAGATSFELRAGTIALLVNPNWKNGGTIGVTPIRVASSSELSTANQAGAISFVNATTYTGNYFRQVIGAAGSGLGTTITAGSKVRCGRFKLTNSVAFSASEAPNFAWRFNASPFAGMNYDNSGASAVLVSNTVNPTYAKINTYRIGSSWSTGSTAGTTISTTAPASAAVDVVFMPGATLSQNTFVCRSLVLMNNASLTITSNGSFSASGNISLGTTAVLSGLNASLFLNGTGASSNQTISGEASNTVYFQNLTAGLTGNTSTKTISMPLAISGDCQLLGTCTLASAGNLRLMSSAVRTARLLELPAGASVTGNVIVERFIPGSSGKKYRYLAAPFVNGPTIANSWQQQIHITGSGTGGAVCPNLTAHTNGFDASVSNSPSMFTFNETGSLNPNTAGVFAGPNFTNAWTSVPNTNSTTINFTQAYRVFVRGNRVSQGCTLLNGATNNAQDVILSASGTLKIGTAAIPLTYSPSNGEGWNLVANPYPSPVNWDAASWTKTNIQNSIWTFRPAGNHFSTYNSALGQGANFGSATIESGNAFFVKAIAANPTLVATESVKTGTAPASTMFKTINKVLRMVFVKPGELSDELVVAMSPDALNGLDAMDSEKMSNTGLNIYAKDGAGHNNAINTFKAAEAETVVPVVINSSFTGPHKFSFKGESEFNAYDVLLEDKYLGVIQLVNDRPTYDFEITANAASSGENRFRLIFVNRGDFDYLKRLQQIYQNINGLVNIYPNPSAGQSEIQVPQLNGTLAHVKVLNAIGQELMNFSSPIQKGNATFQVDLSAYANGVYLIEVTDQSGRIAKGKLIKN